MGWAAQRRDVGGAPWAAFSAAEETVDVPAAKLTAALLRDGLPRIVATFSGPKQPLRPARFDPKKRVVDAAPLLAPPAAPAPSEATQAAHAVPSCPGTTTRVDSFDLNGTAWAACEDLQAPGGALVLASAAGDLEWFEKTYEPYGTNASDGEYYLGLNRSTLANATTDLLGAKLLSQELTWAEVARAAPPIRVSGKGGEWGTDCRGVRTFVGSRGAAYAATIDDWGHVIPGHDWDGCAWVRQVDTIAIQAYYNAVHEPIQQYNLSAAADGIVGGDIPTAIFTVPMVDNGTSTNRYWSVMVVAVPDMEGNREQDFWYRYQQVSCAGAQMRPPCRLHGVPEYWDSYWYSRFPGANASDTLRQTLRTGPVAPASAAGFYKTLLDNRKWWARELAAEGSHDLSLPSPAATNGTWLLAQATHAMIKSMISRESKWHPRYGVSPGYGSVVWNGVPDTLVATATAALEWGSLPYAAGVLDNHFNYYVREDGRVWDHAEAIAASARALTLLALYDSYSGQDGAPLLLAHFDKAKALAEMLLARRNASLQFPSTDPRYGMLAGADDAVHPDAPLGDTMSGAAPPQHFYASAAEAYRAFAELGRVWVRIGGAAARDDVAAHGAVLLKTAPLLYRDLHASLNRTVARVGAQRCWATTAEATQPSTPTFRGYAELLYSGALTAEQIADIYAAASSSKCGPRLLVLGSPALRGAALSTPAAAGLAYGLLQADMADEFLLHYFATSAHAYTRGTHTAPESSDVTDRDTPATAYTAAGEVAAPTYLKWMLCFEEPETRTLWLAKATPRGWLAAGEAPIVAVNLTTRYGRVSYTITPPAATEGGNYTVRANVTLPPSFAASPPDGGVRLRLRAPSGRLSSVTVGGAPWAFVAAEETIDVPAAKLTAALLRDGLPRIVATFA